MKFSKRFWKQFLAVIAVLLLLCCGLAVWAFFIEPNRLVLHEETLSLENWPRELDGLHVAVLSDADTDYLHASIAACSLHFDAVLSSEDLR